MHSVSFKLLGNLVKSIILGIILMCSPVSYLWASGVSALPEEELEIVQRVSDFENAGLTQTAVKLLPQDQRKLYYFGAVLKCDAPILEALYHVLKPQPITLGEYQVYQTTINKDPTLLDLLHQDLRKPMQLLALQDLRSRELNLSCQTLKALPRMIGHYHHATIFNASNNHIAFFPEEIGQLKALEVLNLLNNQLSQLPEEIGQLSALESLYLSSNQFTQLPTGICQLTALRTLELSDNRLMQLPKEISRLSALQALYLSNNRLTQFTPIIAQLSALVWLTLSGNGLTDLPAEISQLSKLGWLDLSGNLLVYLPAEINQLHRLNRLDLAKNQLKQLPPEMFQLAALQTLYLFDNPILDGLNTTTAVQGYVDGSDHIRNIFRNTTNILFTPDQIDLGVQIFGTRE